MFVCKSRKFQGL